MRSVHNLDQRCSMQMRKNMLHLFRHTRSIPVTETTSCVFVTSLYSTIHSCLIGFKLLLPPRVGRLCGETWKTRHCQICFQARPYLTFLALRGYASLDWDWLLAVHDLHVDIFLQYRQFTSNLSSLMEEAVSLGYAPNMVRRELQWAVHRIFLHSGTTRIEDITALQIAEFDSSTGMLWAQIRSRTFLRLA